MTDAERIATLRTRLTNIQAAIDTILGTGTQSHSISSGKSSRQFTNLPLDQLQTLERKTIEELRALGDDDDANHGGAVALKASW